MSPTSSHSIKTVELHALRERKCINRWVASLVVQLCSVA
jgi:hypothetical protein